MGRDYHVQEHKISISDTSAAITALRDSVRAQSNAPKDLYTSEKVYRDCKTRYLEWLALPDAEFLASVTLNDDWQVRIDEHGAIVTKPPEEPWGGLDYDWLNAIAPFVSGYVQIRNSAGDTWRVVWKDGKRGRVVHPVWPEPSDEE